MKSPHEFYLEWNGKGTNVDGYYGFQCWDLFAQFCKEAGYTIPHCIYSGGVKDIAKLYENGLYDLRKNFTSVAVTSMQDGDWIVWGSSQGGGYGHIAMFRKYNSASNVVVLGQNQGASNGVANQINISTSGVIMVLRPNCYKTQEVPSAPKAEKWNQYGIVYVGSTVKSISLPITGVVGNCVNIPALGGLVPLAHVTEAPDSKDGAVDDYLATTNARVYLDPCIVTAIDKKYNRAMVHGYWVNCGPLMVKE